MPVSEATYMRVALEDTDNIWELVCGVLRRKPLMTTEHGYVAWRLGHSLQGQLDDNEFMVRTESARLRRTGGNYFVPAVCVLPMAFVRRLLTTPGTFEVYDDPVPLVVEVWSPSTGDYDVDDKLKEYQRRGDLEIWRIHPYERTLTAWQRQPDGSYTETLHTGGMVRPVALPNVTIDLDALFPVA